MIITRSRLELSVQYNALLLGGLGGRLDQSIHTLSYLLKQREKRPYMMTITDDSLAWVLNSVSDLFAYFIHVTAPQSSITFRGSIFFISTVLFSGPHVVYCP